jgi:hypothetical protein
MTHINVFLIDCGRASRKTRGCLFSEVFELGTPPFFKQPLPGQCQGP